MFLLTEINVGGLGVLKGGKITLKTSLTMKINMRRTWFHGQVLMQTL